MDVFGALSYKRAASPPSRRLRWADTRMPSSHTEAEPGAHFSLEFPAGCAGFARSRGLSSGPEGVPRLLTHPRADTGSHSLR